MLRKNKHQVQKKHTFSLLCFTVEEFLEREREKNKGGLWVCFVIRRQSQLVYQVHFKAYNFFHVFLMFFLFFFIFYSFFFFFFFFFLQFDSCCLIIQCVSLMVKMKYEKKCQLHGRKRYYSAVRLSIYFAIRSNISIVTNSMWIEFLMCVL